MEFDVRRNETPTHAPTSRQGPAGRPATGRDDATKSRWWTRWAGVGRARPRSPAQIPILVIALVLGTVLISPVPGSGGPVSAEESSDGGITATLVLRGGRIWTAVEGAADASAIAIWDERILDVGTDDEIAGMVGPGTRVIDLDGAMVVPGFIDTHIHLSSAARLLLGVNLLEVADEAAFVDAVQAAHERMPAGAWLIGGDWSAYERWPKGADRSLEGEIDFFAPRREMVDGLTADRCILLSRFDRQVWFANGAALEAAGIDRETPDPDRGRIERDPETGEPTGILIGAAVGLVRDVIPEPSHAQRLAETRVALQRIRENGVTTVHDISPSYQLSIYQELLAAGELTARVQWRPTLDRFQPLADLGVNAGFGGPWIKIGAVKGFVDGIMGNSTALFSDPYDHQPDSHGRLRDMMFPEGNMPRLLKAADSAGLQITIHAIGDAANGMLLDMVEDMIAANGERDRRFRVVHAQVLRPRDLPRFAELDLIVEAQPYHTIDDMRWMEQRIGSERSRGAYAFKSLHDSGALLSFGSDWPGTNAAWYPISPILGIYAAVTRQTLGGEPEGGWFGEERLTAEQALLAYTVNNAYAGFEEAEKGTIEPRKLADLTVIDRDIRDIDPATIKGAHVLFTIVGGEVVFEAEGSP